MPKGCLPKGLSAGVGVCLPVKLHFMSAGSTELLIRKTKRMDFVGTQESTFSSGIKVMNFNM